MTFLAELREVAARCVNRLTRHILREVADDLQWLIGELHRSPTEENMRKLNCAWARAARLLCFAKHNGGGGSGGAKAKEVA